MTERKRKRLPRRDADQAIDATRRSHWLEAIEKFLSAARISRTTHAGAIVEGMLLLAAEEHDDITKCSITGELPNLILRAAGRQGIEIGADELSRLRGGVDSALTALRKAAEREVEVEFYGDDNAVLLEIASPGPRGRKRGVYTLRMRLTRYPFADPSVFTGKRIRGVLYDVIEDIDFFRIVLSLDSLGDLGVEIVSTMVGDRPPTMANLRPFIRGIATTLSEYLTDRLLHLDMADALALIQCTFGVRLDIEKLRTADFYPSVLRAVPLPTAESRLHAFVVARLSVLNIVEKLYCIQLLKAFSGRRESIPAPMRLFLDLLAVEAQTEIPPFVGLLPTMQPVDVDDLLARIVDHQKAREKLRRNLEEVRQNPRVR